ncbi:hypothetical protein SEA_SCOUPSA_31 [Microbacterium phage SCoupsA]|nr:hypothetical protein SEA_SCOUPSA_31 [Microbacterium phage SCoupsA]
MKTIRYWDGNNGPYEVEVNEADVEHFRETHPGCEVLGEDEGEDVIVVDKEPPAEAVLPPQDEPIDDATRQASPADVAAVYSTSTPS